MSGSGCAPVCPYPPPVAENVNSICDDSPDQFFSNLSRTAPAGRDMVRCDGGLSAFEIGEMKGYSSIFFFGRHAHLDCSHGRNGASTLVGAHVAYRFEILEVLGQGTFGTVVKALDHSQGLIVALKMIRMDPKLQKHSRAEAKILKLINDQDRGKSVVKMYEYFFFRGQLCISLEVLGPNLYEFQKRNKFSCLPAKDLKVLAKQLLAVLLLLRNNNVVHCDLKPENVALIDNSSKCDIGRGVKVIDFGTSAFVGHTTHTYVQSRFYRAPEVVMGLPYDTAADIWSFGCILAEMATGSPLFPAESEGVLMFQLIRTLGPPPMDMIREGTKSWRYFDGEGLPYLPFRERYPISIKLSDSELFCDFLSRCLRWKSSHRNTPGQLQCHPWLLQ